MIYSVERNRRPAKTICIFLFVAAALCALCSSLGIFYRLIWQILLFGCLITVLEITIRYIITDYEYTVDSIEEIFTHNRLIITHIQGKKCCSVMKIQLKDLVYVNPHKKYSEIKQEFGKAENRYNFCPDIFPKQTYDLVFNEDGEYTLIRLQCGSGFAEELKKRMGV